MKTKSLLIPLVTLGLAGGYGVQQDAKQEELQAEVQALTKRFDAVEGYLQNQAKSMEAFGSAVDAAEEKGFTSGINPESRQALLEGWRAQVKAANQSVPGSKVATTKRVDPRLQLRKKN